MKVYVTGADGMLGTALTTALSTKQATMDWQVHGVSIHDFDIADAEAVNASINRSQPDIVVHTAAHAIVDECEADPKHALRVNIRGTHNVATACRAVGARLVYLSSDYVFDGADPPPGGYRETDAPNPLSVYGLTKLGGEQITSTVHHHLVVRTAWLFGGKDERTDVLLATIGRASRGCVAMLIEDQFSSPTYTVDLAEALVFLLTAGHTGIVHVVNAGTTSWREAADVALRAYDSSLATEASLQNVRLNDCQFLGERPRNSALNADYLKRIGYTMPRWPDAVARFSTQLSRTSRFGQR